MAMADSTNWVLVANPAAGGGHGRKRAERAAAALESAGQTIDLCFTREPGHATELARRAVREKAERLIVCGGDGTIREVVLALAHSPVELGLLPFGTANDFARALSVPRRFDQALHTLLHGRSRRLDLGRVEDRLFCTVAAFGFDAEISHAMSTGRIPFSGTTGYLYAALTHLSTYQPPHVRIAGEFGTFEGEVLLVASGNTSSYGGGMKIVPTADPQDGKLDVCIVGKMSRWKILNVLPRLFSGSHIHHPAVRLERSSWLQIETSRPHIMHADGEYLAETPATLQIEPAALSVILPAANT